MYYKRSEKGSEWKSSRQNHSKSNEWLDLHEAEILTLWEKAQKGEQLNKIEPLK